jgi:hypothetical protein
VLTITIIKSTRKLSESLVLDNDSGINIHELLKHCCYDDCTGNDYTSGTHITREVLVNPYKSSSKNLTR